MMESGPPTASVTMPTYTRDNIEDWDFRSYVSPLRRDKAAQMWHDTGAERFLSTHFTEVIAVDYARIVLLDTLIKHGVGELSDDKEYVMLHPGGESVVRHMSSWRDLLTQDARFQRRVVKSLVREWEKYGRLKFTIMPPDMREQFPGLFADS